MAAGKPWEAGRLSVAPGGRTLELGGRPFFWLGDTAWLLFEKTTVEEAGNYFENRRQKGFNVIQVMVTHKLPVRSLAGRVPFIDNDFTRPDTEGEDSYWNVMDRMLDLAEEAGLYMALVPAWGENTTRGFLTQANVVPYTQFIIDRIGRRPNIVWMVGGDVPGRPAMAIWDTMGEMLRAQCPQHLITYHPCGTADSSTWFHTRPWLDFNMFQSGHYTYAQMAERRDAFLADEKEAYGEDNWRFVEHDLALEPQKPTVDAEPGYEGMLKGLTGPGHDYWGAPDVRRFGYWSAFAGAMGYTYGHSAIMQFHRPGPALAYKPTSTWYEALHHPGSNQMGHLRRLMEDVDFPNGRAARHLLVCEEGSLADRIMVFAADDWLLAHTATGREIEVAPPFAESRPTAAAWFDPVSGVYSPIGHFAPGALPAFKPPRRFDGSEDWVLVLHAE